MVSPSSICFFSILLPQLLLNLLVYMGVDIVRPLLSILFLQELIVHAFHCARSPQQSKNTLILHNQGNHDIFHSCSMIVDSSQEMIAGGTNSQVLTPSFHRFQWLGSAQSVTLGN